MNVWPQIRFLSSVKHCWRHFRVQSVLFAILLAELVIVGLMATSPLAASQSFVSFARIFVVILAVMTPIAVLVIHTPNWSRILVLALNRGWSFFSRYRLPILISTLAIVSFATVVAWITPWSVLVWIIPSLIAVGVVEGVIAYCIWSLYHDRWLIRVLKHCFACDTPNTRRLRPGLRFNLLSLMLAVTVVATVAGVCRGTDLHPFLVLSAMLYISGPWTALLISTSVRNWHPPSERRVYSISILIILFVALAYSVISSATERPYAVSPLLVGQITLIFWPPLVLLYFAMRPLFVDDDTDVEHLISRRTVS